MSSQLPVDSRILDTIAAATASPDADETPASRSTSRSLSIAHRMLTATMLSCFALGGWFFTQNGTTTAAVATTDSTPRYATKNIEDIQPGDLVVAREEHGSRIDRKPVKEVYRRTSYHLRHVTFRSADGSTQTLKTTDEHPFWSVTDNAWIDAGNLKPGAKVTSPAGELQTLAKTHRTEHPEGIPVFNFQVEDSHTYFVVQLSTDQPLLVHNADYDPDLLKAAANRLGVDPGDIASGRLDVDLAGSLAKADIDIIKNAAAARGVTQLEVFSGAVVNPRLSGTLSRMAERGKSFHGGAVELLDDIDGTKYFKLLFDIAK